MKVKGRALAAVIALLIVGVMILGSAAPAMADVEYKVRYFWNDNGLWTPVAEGFTIRVTFIGLGTFYPEVEEDGYAHVILPDWFYGNWTAVENPRKTYRLSAVPRIQQNSGAVGIGINNGRQSSRRDEPPAGSHYHKMET